MFLSNQRLILLLVIGFAVLCTACGSSENKENKQVVLTDELKSEFPFSTKEPEIYQGDFVVTAGSLVQKWFIARSGDKWRFDTFRDGAVSISRMKTDKLYSVDNPKKIYAAEPVNDISSFDALSYGFFKGKEYREFEDMGSEGNLLKYKVRGDDAAKGATLIYVDEASRMMVKQEFTGPDTDKDAVKFTYEIKNLKLEVDDSIFGIPDGYRQVTWEEFQKLLGRQKR